MKKDRLIRPLLVAGVVSFLATSSVSVWAVNEEVQSITQVAKRTLKGKVLDEAGEPMIGASIFVKGTKTGVISNIDGEFTIDLPPGKEVLEVSFMGFDVQTVSVASKTSVIIYMKPNAVALDEVVAIGYGSVRKRDLTGSVVSIKGDIVTATPTSNVMEALQGKIAGADIMRTSGAVGESVDILLRGTRSINGSNSPLFVIDGVQGGSFEQLNPSDIESIDVLKDASSTAIYGSAGANGVVIITTKRAEQGKVVVNFDARVGFSGSANFLHGMIGQEFLDYQGEVYRTKYGAYPEDISQLYSSEVIQGAIQNGKWIDWIDEVTGGHSSQQYYNLSLQGGTDKLKMFSSFNYDKQTGLLSNENQTRYGLRFNVDYQVRKWAKLGGGTNLTYTIKNARGKNIFTKSLTSFPLGDVYDEFGEINEQFIEGETTPLGDQMPDQYANETRTTYNSSNLFAEITPLKGLVFRTQLSAGLSSARQGLYIGKGAVSNVESGYVSPLATINNSFSYGYSWDNTLTYDFTLADDHRFTLTGVTSWSKNQHDKNDMRGQGQSLDYYLFYNIAAGTEKSGIKSSFSQTQKMSYAFRFNYSYLGRYLVSFTTRWDGVSHLAEGHKWAAFPAGAVGWRISDEKFMRGTEKWLSNLKLRFSYGVSGNSGGMGAYSSQTGAHTFAQVSADGATVPHNQLSAPYANPSISWEKSYNKDFGIDLGLFGGRIDLTFDWYNTDTKDLLFSRTLPITSAITMWGSPINTWQNIGETNNKGYEISLTTHNIKRKDFNWTTTFTFTHNEEKIVKLPDGDLVAKNLFEGYPVKTFRNFKYAGIWSTAEAEEAAKYGCEPGYVKIHTVEQFTDDGNGNMVGDGGVHTYSNTRDLQILGSNVPDGILGFNNAFTYKGFDLGVFAIARWGQMIDSQMLGWYDTSSRNQPRKIDYWLPETNEGARFPRPGIAAKTGIESLRFVDGSYIKLKTITLGYTFPKLWLNKIGVQRLRLYGTAYNAITIPLNKALKGTDPENAGSDTFPLYKSYVVGLNFTF